MSEPNSPTPALSIVIATYQRCAHACRAVSRLAAQTSPPDQFEVVVVDDGSTDGTAQALRSLVTPFALHIVEQATRGHAAALNRGVAESRGPVCLFLDDDIEAGSLVAARHIAAHENGGAIAVGRLRTTTPRQAAPLARAMAAWLDAHDARLESRPTTWLDCYGSNTSMPREALIAVGGLRENLPRGFVVELAYRLAGTGLPIVLLADAYAEQRFAKTGAQVARDLAREGASMLTIWRRHPATLAALDLGRHSEPPAQARLARLVLRRLAGAPALLARIDAIVGRTPVAARWHGLVRDACYWHGVRRAASREEWRLLTRAVPILLYHAVAFPGEPASRFVVPADRLERHLRVLRLLRRRPLSLSQYAEGRRAGRPPPRNAVIVTFDDGFDDVVEYGLPILERAGVPATLFIVTSLVGRTATWVAEPPAGGRRLAEVAALRRWLERGGEIGAHTRTHPRLPSLTPSEVAAELAGCRTDLRALLGPTSDVFAYPYGATTPAVIEAAEGAGFAAACGVRPGVNGIGTPLYDLRRVEVDGRASSLRMALGLLGRDAVKRRDFVARRAIDGARRRRR